MSQCPRVDMIRPDFMASGPRVIVEKKGAVFQDDDEDDLLDEDDAVGALDPDYKTFRYYESERVLGQLYRAIDEKKIFQEMQRYATETKSALGGLNLMEQVWAYVLRETALIQWDDYRPLARNIREMYVLSYLRSSTRTPLTQISVQLRIQPPRHHVRLLDALTIPAIRARGFRRQHHRQVDGRAEPPHARAHHGDEPALRARRRFYR